MMIDLFDYLEDCLERRDCDHTIHHTDDFLTARGIAQAPVVHWLNGLNADCDCEVLQNVELTWHALE